MKYNHPINPYDFQNRLNELAGDLVIMWNQAIRRFQVCQAQEPVVDWQLDATQMDMRKHKIRPMFTVQYPNGDYREPDESDLQLVIDSLVNSQTLFSKGYEHVTGGMERADIARETEVAPGAAAAMEWGAGELFKTRVQKGILGFQ